MSKMKSILILAVIASAITAAIIHSAEANVHSTAQADEDNKVYTSKEVDAKAKIRNKLEHLPQRKEDCRSQVRAKARAVLHKSGKVTEVVIQESSGCSYDAEVVRVVRLLKFTPAMKDGHPVSQYSELEYKTNSVRGPRERKN